MSSVLLFYKTGVQYYHSAILWIKYLILLVVLSCLQLITYPDTFQTGRSLFSGSWMKCFCNIMIFPKSYISNITIAKTKNTLFKRLVWDVIIVKCYGQHWSMSYQMLDNSAARFMILIGWNIWAIATRLKCVISLAGYSNMIREYGYYGIRVIVITVDITIVTIAASSSLLS